MTTRCGFSNEVQLTDFGPKEAEISNNLSAVWRVSFAGQYRRSKTRYPYLFLKATDDLQEFFGFRQEILCIFHPYDSIDARLMDAIDELLNLRTNRLDRLCVFVVTNASQLSGDINKYDSEKDLRIHIPFFYKELAGGVAGKLDLIKKRLQDNLYVIDLFATSSVLKTERSFFGRKEEVQSLIGTYERGENASLFGLRRIGKTSLLWAVVRELKHRDVPVAFIDCSDTKYHKASWHKALFRTKEALYTSLGIKDQGSKEADYTESDASSIFVEDLKRIKANSLKPVLLIFDEVENLCFSTSESAEWREGTASLPYWQTIRSAYQQNTNLFSFLICGTNPLILERPTLPSGADNPLYKYVPPKYLDFFGIDEVEGMLTKLGEYMGVSFDKQIFTYMTDEYGGHPFLVRQVASFLKNCARPDPQSHKIKIRREDYQLKRLEIAEKLRGYIGLILSVLTQRYNEEYELLKLLAAGRSEEFENCAAEYPEAISHLIGYGLIKRVGSKYHFRIGSIEQVVRHEARDLVCPESIEERWALIGRERNQFEWKCKKLVRQLLKVVYGERDAKSRLLAIMKNSSQRDKCSDLKFDEIFTDKGELYFLDIKDIIIKNWELFKNTFRDNKPEFQVSMDAANKYRIDSHARDITKDNFRYVMPKLVWLHNCLYENS